MKWMYVLWGLMGYSKRVDINMVEQSGDPFEY